MGLRAVFELARCCTSRPVSFLRLWLKLAAEADWKEKQVKCVAYALRLLSWLLTIYAGMPTPTSRRIRGAYSYFNIARRILWLGRVLGNIPRLQIALSEPDPSARRVSLLGIFLGSINNVIDDAITLDRTGVLPPGLITARTWQMAGTTWFGTTVCGLIVNRWQMRAMTDDFRRNLSEVTEISLILNFGLNIPYTLGGRAVSELPDGWFAVFGLLSGLVSSFKIWVCAHHAESMEKDQALRMSQADLRMSQTVDLASMAQARSLSQVDLASLMPHDSPSTPRIKEEGPVPTALVQASWYEIRRHLSSNRIAALENRQDFRHSFS